MEVGFRCHLCQEATRRSRDRRSEGGREKIYLVSSVLLGKFVFSLDSNESTFRGHIKRTSFISVATTVLVGLTGDDESTETPRGEWGHVV